MSPSALVTGGSRGIGLGITERLLDEGYRVAVLATRPEPEGLMDHLAERGEAMYLQGSVADVESHAGIVEAVVERFGRIDLLVNNAGVAPTERRDILEATPDSFDRVLGINLRGPYFLTQAVARQMVAQDGQGEYGLRGTIINVGSISATAVSLNRGEYCLSKAGVGMATQLWARRLAPEGVLVYEVRPGVIATDMTAGVKDRYDELFAEGLAPIHRWGVPSDVAGAIAQLAAGQMPYSTGEVINVDGGMHIPEL